MSNRTPLITLIIFIAAVVVALSLTIPGYQQLGQRKNELISEEAKLEEAKEINQKLQDLAEQYNQYQDEAEKIEASLPNGEDIPGLLVSLETMAAENGLVLQSLDFSTQPLSSERLTMPEQDEAGSPRFGEAGQVAPPTKPYHRLNLSMSLNGSYGALKNWLAALQENMRIIDVKSISFGSGKGEGIASDIFDYDITAVTYYR